MKLSRIVLSTAALAVMAGCAVPQPKVATQEWYEGMAGIQTVTMKCNETGRLDPELASLSMARLETLQRSVSHDPTYLQSVVQSYRDQYPSDANCNEMAMHLHTLKRNIASNNARVSSNQQAVQGAINNRPKQTYCNRIGTQTLCSTH